MTHGNIPTLLKTLTLFVMLLSTTMIPAGDTQKSAAAGPRTRNVAIVLYDGVEVLDFAGPSEVFAAAAGFGGLPGAPAYRVYTMSATKAPLTSQGFVRVTPEFSIDDAPKPDIIVLPGGNSAALTEDVRFMTWAKRAISDAEVTLTVCTGAFVAAKAGALDGRPATTWYNAIPRLKEAAPKTDVQEGRRFIDSGNVVTTAGVSAGIDGALHVVARLSGRSAADRTARYMEYHWTPEPYLAKGYSHLNPGLDETGRAMQQAILLEDEQRYEEAATAWRALLARDPGRADAWYHLGIVLHSLGRYDDAVDAGRRAASASEALRPQALYVVACARALQGHKDEAMQALEQAVAAGFKSKSSIQHDPDFESLRAEARFQALLAKL